LGPLVGRDLKAGVDQPLGDDFSRGSGPPVPRAARAKELASKAIDKLTIGTPDNDETAARKRRLITRALKSFGKCG
jgi:hypothetical protein